MNLSEIFIRRPIATSLIMLAIALFGVIAYRALPVSDLPNVDYPTLQVSAGLPGGDPGTMASAVATPLERQFTAIAGLDSMSSSSGSGRTSITLQFSLDRDIDGAAVDVQTAIAEAMPLLPAGMPSPPSFHKSNPADSPVLFMAVTSDTVPLWVLDEYAEHMIAQRISMVNDVAEVTVWGSTKYAVRVQVDPDKLAAKQIGINEIDRALQNWNVNLPTGTLYGANRAWNVQATGQLMNAEEFRPVVVACGDGGFLFTAQELATAVQQHLDLCIVLFNNDCYGAIRRNQQRRQGGRVIDADLVNPDFVKFAGSFGIKGVRLASYKELGPAVEGALGARELRLIEVPIHELTPPW